MNLRENAKEITYTKIKLLGNDVLYTDLRVDISTVPKGLHRYELREDGGDICGIGKNIMINFWGTILSKKPINLGKYGYREINEDTDINDDPSVIMTIDNYTRKIAKKKDYER